MCAEVCGSGRTPFPVRSGRNNGSERNLRFLHLIAIHFTDVLLENSRTHKR